MTYLSAKVGFAITVNIINDVVFNYYVVYGKRNMEDNTFNSK